MKKRKEKNSNAIKKKGAQNRKEVSKYREKKMKIYKGKVTKNVKEKKKEK